MVPTRLEVVPNTISDALKVEAVARLLESIQAKCEVRFERSRESWWSSGTEDCKTIIEYAPCRHPAEALAHELLHAELKLGGYRPLGCLLAKRPCLNKRALKELLRIVDNELQHHKIFSRFQGLGLQLVHFYHDGDINVFKKVRRSLGNMNKANSTAEFFSLFVTVIAPGGAADAVGRIQLKKFLQTRCSNSTWTKLLQIEDVFARWRMISAVEPAPFVKEILELIDTGDSYWVGNPAEFPASGFFIGSQFERGDAE